MQQKFMLLCFLRKIVHIHFPDNYNSFIFQDRLTKRLLNCLQYSLEYDIVSFFILLVSILERRPRNQHLMRIFRHLFKFSQGKIMKTKMRKNWEMHLPVFYPKCFLKNCSNSNVKNSLHRRKFLVKICSFAILHK